MNWFMAVLFIVVGIARIVQGATGHYADPTSFYVSGVVCLAFGARRVYRAIYG